MKRNSLIRYAGVFACAGFLYASSAVAGTEKVIYSFKAGTDGAAPWAGLINVKGTFYGTTLAGGKTGLGTVFSVSSRGKEKVLYSFKGGSDDGEEPYASVIDVKGTLYGTTLGGGTGQVGTVFSLTPTGTEKVLHSFSIGTSDGSAPLAGLVAINGTLYGTTPGGGASTSGTVFSVVPGKSEKLVYSFKGGNDGAGPQAGMIDVKGKLYGTTSSDGASSNGTVFSITTSGTEKVISALKAGGSDPTAPLVDVKGTFYGTTQGGGAAGHGTVFSVTSKGTEKLIVSFKGGKDGDTPVAGLVDLNGTLYGTTLVGGGTGCEGNGCGTIFSVNPTTGAETVVYAFCSKANCADGFGPHAGLINVKGTLYGTTFAGGADFSGTVYSFKP